MVSYVYVVGMEIQQIILDLLPVQSSCVYIPSRGMSYLIKSPTSHHIKDGENTTVFPQHIERLKNPSRSTRRASNCSSAQSSSEAAGDCRGDGANRGQWDYHQSWKELNTEYKSSRAERLEDYNLYSRDGISRISRSVHGKTDKGPWLPEKAEEDYTTPGPVQHSTKGTCRYAACKSWVVFIQPADMQHGSREWSTAW